MARTAARPRPEPPDLPRRFDAAPESVTPGAVLDGVELDGTVEVPPQVSDLSVIECRWTGADLSGRRLGGLVCRDTEFVRVDLSGAVLDGARLTRVVFRDCRLTGLVLTAAQLTDVRITECRADLLVLREARAEALLVEGGTLAGADLQECDARGARLLDTDLTGVNLDRARLTGAALHGSTVADVLEPRALADTRIAAEQAVEVGQLLLDALGVRVEPRPAVPQAR